MENQYVGDIGDYIKLSLLRAVCGAHRLGIAWWLVPDERHKKDGRHISYLNDPKHWRSFEPGVFDRIREIVVNNIRSIEALETAELLPPETVFHSTEVACPTLWSRRAAAREKWFGTVLNSLANATMVFVDPDNGIEPARYSVTRKNANKSITVSELHRLTGQGRILIVYHHHTRMRGGHINELGHVASRLKELTACRIDALRAKAYSPRAFFLINADGETQVRAADFAQRWVPHVTWHPNLGKL
jgi:hypothetical protein